MFSKLDVTQGNLIAGVEVSPGIFLGRLKAAQLFQIAPNPLLSENKRSLETSKEFQELYAARQDIQRVFEGQKKANLPSYAKYIVDLKHGAMGLTPPIILYSEDALDTEQLEYGLAGILVPFGRPLIAIDGETQLAARYEAAEMSPDTKQDFVGIVIAHGRKREWARQAFHDLNVLGVKPNAALSIGMDARDPLTQVARDVEAAVPQLKGRVNKFRRQLRGSDKDVVTITALRGACVTLAVGIAGVKYGAKPVPVAAADVERIRGVAIEWFGAVWDAINPAIEDRETKLASAPAVLAAIGAMGHELLNVEDPSVRKQRMQHLISKLRAVNWRRDQHWAGIAGKVTPKGELSVGGTKETVYAVYDALVDETSVAFPQVRMSGQPAAAAA